jgi:hypothetical protein
MRNTTPVHDHIYVLLLLLLLRHIQLTDLTRDAGQSPIKCRVTAERITNAPAQSASTQAIHHTEPDG